MEVKSSFEIKNIIWAVDVFTDIPMVEEIVEKNISHFLTAMNIKPRIYPINVFPGIHTDDHFPFVEEEINHRLAKIKIPNLQPIKVIPENMIYPTSINDKVLTLIDYAKTVDCDLIVATTHSQQSTSHFIIGSFTNELYIESPISLLILNPTCEVKTQFNHILLPLDNTAIDKTECQTLANISKQLNAKLTFFYHIHDKASHYFKPEGLMWKMFKNQQHKLERKIEAQQNTLKEMLHDEFSNYDTTTSIDTFTLKESINRFIKANDISLVLLGSLGSNVPNKLPPSVVEYIIRSANCPVLIFKATDRH